MQSFRLRLHTEEWRNKGDRQVLHSELHTLPSLPSRKKSAGEYFI